MARPRTPLPKDREPGIARATALVLVAASRALGCGATSSHAPASDTCPQLDAVGFRALGEGARVGAEWDAFVATLGDDAVTVAASVESRRRSVGLPLRLWTGPEILTDQRIAGIVNANHPCAATVEVVLDAMPRPTTSDVYEPDLVVEMNELGKTFRAWRIPVDSSVAGVRGDEILVPRRMAPICGSVPPSETRVMLALVPSGAFRVEPDDPALPKPERMLCPRIEAFRGSDFVGCWKYRDLESGEERRLAYQGPCT